MPNYLSLASCGICLMLPAIQFRGASHFLSLWAGFSSVISCYRFRRHHVT